MISGILDKADKKNHFFIENKLENLEFFAKETYGRMSKEDIFAINNGKTESRLIKNNMLIIPSCVSDMYEKLGGYGPLSEQFQFTQKGIRTHVNGEKRMGGLWVTDILGFCDEQSQITFVQILYKLSFFYDDRFFPIACTGDWYYFFLVSLDDQSFGAVFGLETYGANPLFDDDFPQPKYLYPNIDAFLEDLGPKKSYEETALPEGVTPLMS